MKYGQHPTHCSVVDGIRYYSRRRAVDGRDVAGLNGMTEKPLNGRGSPRDPTSWVALNDFIFPNVLAATVALK